MAVSIILALQAVLRDSVIFVGGADTTVSAEYAFYLAMVLYPGNEFRCREFGP